MRFILPAMALLGLAFLAFLVADHRLRAAAETEALADVTLERVRADLPHLSPDRDLVQRCARTVYRRFYPSQVCYRLGLSSRDHHGAIAYSIVFHEPLSLVRPLVNLRGYFRATEYGETVGVIYQDGSVRLFVSPG